MIRTKEIAEALYVLHHNSIMYQELSLLQKALALYENHAVITMDLEPSKVIIAQVRDAVIYETKLNIYKIGNSQCTCSSKGMCVHLIALFFAAYAHQGFRPELIVKKAAEPAGKPPAKPQETTQSQHENTLPATRIQTKKSPSVSSNHLQEATKPKQAIVSKSDSVAVWHSYYHAWFKHFTLSKDFKDFDKNMNNMHKHFSELCQDWPPISRDFFMMHVSLFKLQKLEEFALNTFNKYPFNRYSNMINNAINEGHQGLINHLTNLRNADPSKLSLQHREQTAKLLSVIAFPKDRTPINWGYFYRMIWNVVLRLNALEAPEKLRLQNILKQTKLSNIQRLENNIALAYHWFMTGNDSRAMSCLEETGISMELMDNSFNYMKSLLQIKEWERLTNWLLWLKPKLVGSSKELIEDYLAFWKALVPETISEEIFLNHIADFLPVTSTYYMDQLIQQAKYVSLIDYMTTYDLSISILPTEIRRKLESKQPELFLPYYHRMTEHFISFKNRVAYLEAVNSMKKIQAIYKKIKQPQHWQRYSDWIKSHYSRLSALQEEISKGLK